jgi:hypothetical protein
MSARAAARPLEREGKLLLCPGLPLKPQVPAATHDFAVRRYCSGILACLITLPQSSVSSTKNCAASLRLLVTGSI